MILDWPVQEDYLGGRQSAVEAVSAKDRLDFHCRGRAAT